jgi:pyruvate/2-oxoglutarate dehydrogenase complex dihydrolipoamide dehydrogenase (E3) component
MGLEMGSVWSRLGADVTVVEFLGQIGGPGMDAEISKNIQKTLGKQGMKFKLNTKVNSGDDSGELVKLEVEAAKGGKNETVGLLLTNTPQPTHTDFLGSARSRRRPCRHRSPSLHPRSRP